MRKAFNIRLTLIAVLSALGLGCFASESSNLLISRNLPNLEIRCFTQSGNSIWVGTGNGFVIIQNGIWKEYSLVNRDSGGLEMITSTNFIAAEGKDALICTPTMMVRFDSATELCSEPVTYLDNTIIPDAVTCLDGCAYLFARSFCSLFKYDFRERELSLIKTLGEPRTMNFTEIIIPRGHEGSIMLFDPDQGVFSYDMSGGSLTQWTGSPKSIDPRTALMDSGSQLWLSEDNKGITKYSLDFNTLEMKPADRYLTDGRELPECRILDAIDCDEDVIVCTNGYGLAHLGKEEHKSYRLKQPSLAKISSLFNAGDNIILGGTSYNGLISIRESFCGMLSSTNMDPDLTIPDNAVYSMLEDGDLLWISSESGIDCFDMAQRKVLRRNSFLNTPIVSLARLNDRQLLAVCLNDGLAVYDKATGTLEQLSTSVIPRSSKGKNDYRKTLAVNDSNGNVVIFNLNNTNYILNPSDNSVKSFDIAYSNSNEYAQQASIDRTGFAIIKYEQYLYEYDLSTGKTRCIFEAPTPICSISRSTDDNLWFAAGTTIYEFEPSKNRVTEQATAQLRDGCIFTSCVAGSCGTVWITSTLNKLRAYDIASKKITLFPSTHMSSNNYLPNPVLAAGNCMSFIVGTAGILMIDANQYDKNESFDRDVDKLCIFLDNRLLKDIPENEPLTVPGNYYSLRIHVNINAPDALSAIPVKYNVSKGGKTSFEYISNQSYLNIAHLSAGNYVLSARILGDDNWKEPVTLLEFKVKRPWYASILAFTAYALLFLAIMGSVSYFSMKSQRTHDLMQEYESSSASTRHKMELISHLAHNVRSPLSLIYSNILDFRETSPANGYLYKKLTEVLAQVKKAGRLATEAMNVPKVADSARTINVSSIKLNEWLDGIISDHKIECEARGLKINFEPDHIIQIINTDVQKVEIGVLNLLSNAIKYNENSVITVKTAVLSQRYVRISVSDRGPGLGGKPDAPFSKPEQDKADFYGYGVGLHSVRMLFNTMGSRVGAQDRDGGGATFWIDVPLMAATLVGNEIDTEAGKQTAKDNFIVDSKTKTILFVDDQQDMLDYVIDEYESKFNKVFTAHDGSEALVVIGENRPDIIVSDIMMPHMNGFELCKAVKSNLEFSHIPFIALSSKTESSHQVMSYKLGPDDFVAKPFDMEVLYKAIVYQLSIRNKIVSDLRDGHTSRLTEENTISSADDAFVKKLNGCIDAHISDITPIDLAKMMEMGCKQLSRKILGLTGLDINKYIQSLRNEKKI